LIPNRKRPHGYTLIQEAAKCAEQEWMNHRIEVHLMESFQLERRDPILGGGRLSYFFSRALAFHSGNGSGALVVDDDSFQDIFADAARAIKGPEISQ